VTYQEFICKLKKQNTDIKDIALALGYSKESIVNNWKKTNKIPPRVILAMDMYFKLQDKEKSDMFNENVLSKEAMLIAKYKCEKYNITLTNYLTSLVLSHL